MQAPKFPFPIDSQLARRGEGLFAENCSRCHGTYGPNGSYPNKIVPLKVIGTDPSRFTGLGDKYGEFYNQSWFAKEKPEGFKVEETAGYQAPPLDGVWATAPYLHNGSVPTLYDVVNSRARPRIFTRSFRTDEEAYDKIKVGWKVEELREIPASQSPHERRKIYDTSRRGRSNAGHTFGDSLSEGDRRAVIEYLKTL
jgi:cytochrome c peroxidase